MGTLYQITQWRKNLERRGWIGIHRASPPRHKLIEYHLIWKNHLVSGRIRLSDEDHDQWLKPGSPTYLFMRGIDVIDGAWRVAQDQTSQAGQVHRRFPA